MKRIALLTVLLLSIGLASAFAADPIVPIMSSVSAEVQWGINLDNMINGFLNTPTLTIYLPLLTYGSMTDKGTGDFYGEIDLTNIEVSVAYNVLPMNSVPAYSQFYFTQKVNYAVEDKAATAASAFIIAKPWNMGFGVYAAPGMGLGHGIYLSQTDAVYGTLAPFATATMNPVVPVGETAGILATPYGTYGTYIEYGAVTSTPLNLFFKVLSSASWTAATQPGYAVGVDGTLTFAPLTLGFGAYQGFNPATVVWAGAPTQGYVTVGLAQPMGDMKIAADVKTDFSLPSGGTFAYEVSGDAYFYISAVKDKDGNPQYSNYLTANFLYGSKDSFNDLSVHFAAVEDATNGFVPNLGLKVEGNLVNLMNAMAYDVIANGSYKVVITPDINVTPSVAFWYGKPYNQDALLHLIPALTFNLGVVQNASIAVVWTGNDLLPEPGGKLALGILNFNVTITY